MAIGANLTQRDQALISVAVVVAGLAGAWGYFLYSPKQERLAAIEQHVVALEAKNETAKADVASGSIDRLRQQAAEYEASLVLLQQLVPTTNEVPALLENVSTAARRVGLDLASVEPMPVIIGEQFDTYRYKLSVKGGYHALAGFLSNVGSLSRIVAPVSIDIGRMPPNEEKLARLREGESGLETSFQIQTYIARTAPQLSAAEGGTAP